MLFDTHAHLNDERYKSDLDETILRAFGNGVSKILIPSYDERSSYDAVKISLKYDSLYCSVGIHPHDANNYNAEVEFGLRNLVSSKPFKVVAIGEIGLDYHYDHSPRDKQKEAFISQIKIAYDCEIPFIVHDREAHGDIIEIIEEMNDKGLLAKTPGVFHCFSGSAESAVRLIDLGFFISFAGPITFKNSRKATEVLSAIPLDRILIETDCPYLSPEPFRGKRNEPAFVKYVAAKMAEIIGISEKEVADITYDNACKLFKIRN